MQYALLREATIVRQSENWVLRRQAQKKGGAKTARVLPSLLLYAHCDGCDGVPLTNGDHVDYVLHAFLKDVQLLTPPPPVSSRNLFHTHP